MPFQHFSFLLLILIILMLSFSFLRILAFPDATWSLDKGERVNLSPKATLFQTFTAHHDNLRQIEILFGKFTLEKSDVLILELVQGECTGLSIESLVLATEDLSSRSFDSEHPYTFVFDPIRDSENQRYCFMATFGTDRVIDKNKAPRFFTDLSKEEVPYTLSSERDPGTDPIAIRPGYTNNSILTTFQELIDRISQYKPAFLKDGWLLFFASSGLIFTFLIAVLLMREEEKE